MKKSKEQLVNSILFFAREYGLEDSYRAIFKSYVTSTTPEIVKMIIHDMFLHEFSHVNCTKEEWYHYNIIFEYSTELNKKGWVTFDLTNGE